MSSSHPRCSPDAAPESYRAKVTSTVEVAALVYQPLPASGALLRVLRGSLYHKRGVRNVMDVVAVHLTPPTAADGSDARAASSSASVRVDFHAPDSVHVADLPPSTTPTGAHRVMTGPCKVCLLDPAVLTPACLCLPSDVSSNTTAVFTLGAGVADCDVTQALAAAVSERQLSTSAADLLQRLHTELAGSISTAAAALATKSSSKKKAPFAGPVQVAFTTVSVELTYKNYTMPELLSMVLPVQEEDSAVVALSGFEQVGHIAHVNLSTANVPYAALIGQVILDCNETVDIAVNKAESISSVFREFKMDIIAERPNTFDESGERIRHDDDALVSTQGPALTKAEKELLALSAASAQTSRQDARLNRMLTATVRQHGCNFRVPYNRVYWNSRLSFEHTRLVEAMRRGDRLFDVMAGVGPFAVPAAQNGVEVWANDLNPAAADYMKVNAELNHVPPSKMHVYNMDGRAFLNTVLFDSVMGLQTAAVVSVPWSGRRHVTMNLPAIAVEFLNVFQPLRSDGTPVQDDAGVAVNTRWNTLPAAAKETAVDKHVLFHVYCFSAAEDLLADAVAQCEQHLGYALPKENVEEVLMVRDVAPTKRMMCVSFTLPEAFWTHLFASTGVEGGTALPQGSEPAAKKAKPDSLE